MLVCTPLHFFTPLIFYTCHLRYLPSDWSLPHFFFFCFDYLFINRDACIWKKRNLFIDPYLYIVCLCTILIIQTLIRPPSTCVFPSSAPRFNCSAGGGEWIVILIIDVFSPPRSLKEHRCDAMLWILLWSPPVRPLKVGDFYRQLTHTSSFLSGGRWEDVQVEVEDFLTEQHGWLTLLVFERNNLSPFLKIWYKLLS